MKEIALSVCGRVNAGKYSALVDEIDSDWASRFAWSAKVHRLGVNTLIYAFRSEWINGRNINFMMHREVMARALDVASEGLEVDHIEHGSWGGLDNRRSNLRLVTHERNRINSRRYSNNTSGVPGVYWYRRKNQWKVQLTIAGSPVHFGYFDDFDSAVVVAKRERSARELVACR